MDLIHPASKRALVEDVRAACADGRRLLVVGGRQHMDRGNPSSVDAELWTTQLDRIVSFDAAEMIVVAEAGVRMRELRARLAIGGQEWPVDAPDAATVGGVIATGVSSPRRLRVGHVRDTVVEMEIVTGTGDLIRSGARTVKNVTGYDVHRLAVGSLGTLGVIVQVALKVRPLPQAVSALRASGDGMELGRTLLEAVPAASLIATTQDAVTIRLEGWLAEVAALTDDARLVVPGLTAADTGLPSADGLRSPIVAEVAVPPSRLSGVLAGSSPWHALVGTGIAWVGVKDEGELGALRERVAAAGGIAPAVRGPGGLGETRVAAPAVHRRLKSAFDPAGILAPGRFWAGI